MKVRVYLLPKTSRNLLILVSISVLINIFFEPVYALVSKYNPVVSVILSAILSIPLLVAAIVYYIMNMATLSTDGLRSRKININVSEMKSVTVDLRKRIVNINLKDGRSIILGLPLYVSAKDFDKIKEVYEKNNVVMVIVRE